MSEDENFLARWSRRKQEVAKDEARPDQERATAPPAEQDDNNAGSKANADTPAVDLTKLPSLHDITAETDISGFLQHGVPTDLARAALRRAWASDPAIRDFVGLQENDWVFNKPGPDQGFGPLGPDTDVAKLLAQVFGEGPKEEPTAAPNEDAPAPAQAIEPAAAAVAAKNNSEPTSPQQNDAAHNKAADKVGRSHGSALPRGVSES